MVRSFKVMSSLFKIIDYDEHFLVVNFVILFRERELARKERYEMEVLFGILRERPADSKVGSVGFYVNG